MPPSITLCSSQRDFTALSAGSIIAGKYQLEALVGEGGMGAVWRAHNLQLESQVAIKLLRAGPKSEELGERLKIEARAVAQLAHPSIVRVFDVGETENGEPFIVMELLTGEGLATVLARGPLSGVQAVQLLLPIAEALTLAHKKGIVHRDIKPDNVFISNGDDGIQPKLLDFGIAKLTGELSGGRSLTEDGTLLGSPDYMSPEQVYGGADVDHRSDMWSFSVVLYECLTGFVPFKAANSYALLRAIVEKEPIPFPEEANIDESLAQIIRSGLLKDKHLRPSSMHELGCNLARWLLNQGVVEDACGASLETRWSVPAAGFQSLPPRFQEAAVSSQRSQALSVSDELETPAAPRVFDSTPAPSIPKLQRSKRSWAFLVSSLMLGGGVVWASLGLLPVTPEAEAKRGTLAPAELVSRTTTTLAPKAPEVEVSIPQVTAVAPETDRPRTGNTLRAPRIQKSGLTRAIQPAPKAPQLDPSAPEASIESTPRERPAPPPRNPGIDLMDPY